MMLLRFVQLLPNQCMIEKTTGLLCHIKKGKGEQAR